MKYDRDGDSSTGTCDQCLNPGWWEGLNLTLLSGINDDQGYYNPDSAENHYNDGQSPSTWTPSHAGSGNDAVDDLSPQFEGGFAGNCRNDFGWTYIPATERELDDPKWDCRGEELRVTTTSDSCEELLGERECNQDTLRDFTTTAYLPEIDYTESGRTIGITLFPYNNQPQSEREYLEDTSLSSQIDHYSEVSNTGVANPVLERVSVECWAGGLDEKPDSVSSSDRGFIESRSVNDELTTITSEVTGTDGYSGYSCEWWYTASDRDGLVRGQASDVISLHKDRNRDDLRQMRDNGADIPE